MPTFGSGYRLETNLIIVGNNFILRCGVPVFSALLGQTVFYTLKVVSARSDVKYPETKSK